MTFIKHKKAGSCPLPEQGCFRNFGKFQEVLGLSGFSPGGLGEESLEPMGVSSARE